MQIGYKASAEQFGPQELAEFAVLAEQLGLDSVMISDHFQPWRLTGGHAPSALAWLPWVLARTERVLVGTSVLTPTFRYNPSVIAQTFATMGCMAPGRVILGVGSGEALNEIAVGSVADGAWPEFKERFGRLREAVSLIQALWSEDEVTFEGDYYRTVGARVYDRPKQAPAVYIAAGGPMVARYAGRVGDGFICTSGKGTSLYSEQLLPAVAEGREKAGRAGEPIDRMIEMKISYDRDAARAAENCRFWAPLSLSAEQKHSITSPEEMEAAADQLPLETVTKRWIVTSDPSEVVSRVKEYTDLGFNHLVVHGPGHDQERFLTSFAEDVVPGLRELVPNTTRNG
jgi:coenzyme F420-dependent glucose-6-phosphate dehydrogenase